MELILNLIEMLCVQFRYFGRLDRIGQGKEYDGVFIDFSCANRYFIVFFYLAMHFVVE